MRVGILWLLLVVSVGGCNYRKDKLEMPLNAPPTYRSVMRYVLEPKCLSCHTGPSSPKGVDLSTYEALKQLSLVVPKHPEASPLFDSILSGRMPKGQPRLSETQIQLVKSWIVAGALEDGGVNPPPLPPEPTFRWIFENLLVKRCVGCHSGQDPKTSLDLRTYESIMNFSGDVFKAVEAGDPDFSGLYVFTSNGSMPPNGTSLTNQETDMIFEWIKKGATP